MGDLRKKSVQLGYSQYHHPLHKQNFLMIQIDFHADFLVCGSHPQLW